MANVCPQKAGWVAQRNGNSIFKAVKPNKMAQENPSILDSEDPFPSDGDAFSFEDKLDTISVKESQQNEGS